MQYQHFKIHYIKIVRFFALHALLTFTKLIAFEEKSQQ